MGKADAIHEQCTSIKHGVIPKIFYTKIVHCSHLQGDVRRVMSLGSVRLDAHCVESVESD